jgi:UDP-N-acetylglucosamine 2-epimerase (non-hydrolysing)
MTAVIDVIAGARPNFMKVAPILRQLAGSGDSFRARLVHTGQHYDEALSDVFFRQLEIQAPDIHLGAGSGPHGEQTARILAAYEKLLLGSDSRPRGVVVVGDVNSTLACTLAAVKLGVPVAHVEAGLRSFDRSMPEEINRVMTDAVADVLLPSEPAGVENLLREGVDPKRIRRVGNLMIDTLARQLEGARSLNMAATLGLERGRYALVTLHRPSNVDEPARLKAVLQLLGRMADRLPVVFPVHPRTRERIRQFGMSGLLERVKAVDALGYRENLSLMSSACFALTDSGGIQEETSYLGIPCLTLRANTERPVTVTQGTNTVVGEDPSHADALMADILAGRYKKGQPIEGWDGRAAARVVDALQEAWT